jgi:hypothetical protein
MLDTITIDAGAFFIRTGSTAIGTGYGNHGASVARSVTIRGGIFILNAGIGTGIGAGESNSGVSSIDSILIEAGSFNIATDSGSGVGAGEALYGQSVVRSLTIHSGQFTIHSFRGAGVGAGYGYGENGQSRVGTIWIFNGSFDMRVIHAQPIGIARGQQNGVSEVASVVLSDGSVVELVAETDWSSTFGALSLFAGHSQMNCVTNTTRLLAPDADTSMADLVLYGQYRHFSVAEAFSDLLLLHFVNISMLKGDRFVLTIVYAGDQNVQREVVYDGQNNTGLIVSVPAEGEYRIQARGSDGIVREVVENGRSTFPVVDGEVLIESRAILPAATDIHESGLSQSVIGAISIGALILVGLVVGVIAFRMNPSRAPREAEPLARTTPGNLPRETAPPDPQERIGEEDDLETILE